MGGDREGPCPVCNDFADGYDAGYNAAIARIASLLCECRPLDLSRDSHSHDCDVDFFDTVRSLARKPGSAEGG